MNLGLEIKNPNLNKDSHLRAIFYLKAQ